MTFLSKIYLEVEMHSFESILQPVFRAVVGERLSHSLELIEPQPTSQAQHPYPTMTKGGLLLVS